MTRCAATAFQAAFQKGLSFFCSAFVCLANLYRVNLYRGASRLLAIFAITFSLAACEARIASHGHSIDDAELAQIELGSSTRVDLLAGLGQPSFEGAFGSNKLYYVSQIMIEPAGGKKTTQSRTIFVFTIDKNDVVSEIDVLDETTGNVVAHLDATTPTPGDNFGIVDQIFSNLKKRRAEE